MFSTPTKATINCQLESKLQLEEGQEVLIIYKFNHADYDSGIACVIEFEDSYGETQHDVVSLSLLNTN